MSLPFLPGMTFSNPVKDNWKKSQAFGFRNGVPVFDLEKPGIGGELLDGQKPKTMKMSAAASVTLQASGGKYVPAWVAFDRQVLRFFAYFLESVVESRQESFRVRKCEVLYYLEDDTMQVVEPKQENSGIPQGTLIKRHRIVREGDADDYYTVHDLNIGVELTMYGRTFRIVDCDKFTETFVPKLGIQLNAPEPYPEDSFAKSQVVGTKSLGVKSSDAVPREERLKLRQFLENDRKVLRFFARWDNRDAMFGDVRFFQILYFCADDTVAVNEINPPNAGRDPFPQFVQRCKLPKGVARLGAKVDTYKDKDFTIGKEVNVLGRNFFIYDCDQFTREYYQSKYAQTLPAPIDVSEPTSEQPKREVPPYMGFGTEEDSLGSVSSLVNKPPKKDFKKMQEFDGKTLRFSARMLTDRPEDVNRRFIVSYFMADDTLLVFEPPQRNSGINGGKYLERSKVKRSDTGEIYQPTDLFVGAVIEVCRRDFLLFDADEFAFRYMEAHVDQWPLSDCDRILKRLQAPLQGEIGNGFRAAAEKNTVVPVDQMRELLMDERLNLQPQEIVTVLRRYSSQGDGLAFLGDFLTAVLG